MKIPFNTYSSYTSSDLNKFVTIAFAYCVGDLAKKLVKRVEAASIFAMTSSFRRSGGDSLTPRSKFSRCVSSILAFATISLASKTGPR